MESHVNISRTEGDCGEQALSIESASGMAARVTEQLRIAPDTSFLSVFVSNPTSGVLGRADGVDVLLRAPDGMVYQPSAKAATGGTLMVELDIGKLMYLPEPAEGIWTLELHAKAASPFSCEVRAMPDYQITSATADPMSSVQAKQAKSLAAFVEKIPTTMLTTQMQQGLENCASPTNGADQGLYPNCGLCKTTVAYTAIGFGLGALITAAILLIFLPVAWPIAAALGLVGIFLITDVIISALTALASAIARNPIVAISPLSILICESAKICPPSVIPTVV